MADKLVKSKFTIENKEDSNKKIVVTISFNIDHTCPDIDRVIESMAACCMNGLNNYKAETKKKKKNKSLSSVSNVV